jgi:hypothetical protein
MMRSIKTTFKLLIKKNQEEWMRIRSGQRLRIPKRKAPALTVGQFKNELVENPPNLLTKAPAHAWVRLERRAWVIRVLR